MVLYDVNVYVKCVKNNYHGIIEYFTNRLHSHLIHRWCWTLIKWFLAHRPLPIEETCNKYAHGGNWGGLHEYCRVPAGWGLQQTTRAPGSDKTRGQGSLGPFTGGLSSNTTQNFEKKRTVHWTRFTKTGWTWHVTIYLCTKGNKAQRPVSKAFTKV